MARRPIVQEVEETPESDRLDGFPHPRHTKTVFGHDAAARMLADVIAGGRVHHGWLVTGAEGIGKATLAYAFIRSVLASPAERTVDAARPLTVADNTVAFRQVAALSHPGLLVLRRPWDPKAKRHTTVIPVDEVRRLKQFLAHKADEGAWRAVLVDTADDLNASSANAILKSLEEPPPRTVFILLSAEPGRLLPTIRSRCRLLALAPLGPQHLRAAVEQAIAAGEDGRPPSPGEWPQLTEIAQGSVRRALAVSSSGGLKLYERVQAIVGALPAVDWSVVHAVSDELAGAAAEQKFEQFFALLLELLGRLVRAAATGEGSPSDRAAAKALITPQTMPRFAALWSDISAAKAVAMALNLDRKALVIDTIAKLAAAAG